MRISRPAALELEYTRHMMVPLLLRDARGVAASGPADRSRRGLADALSVQASSARGADGCRNRARGRSTPRASTSSCPPRARGCASRSLTASTIVASSEREFDLHPGRRLRREGPHRIARLAAVLLQLPRASARPRRVVAANLLTRSHGIRGELGRMRAAFGDGVARAAPNAQAATWSFSAWPAMRRKSRAQRAAPAARER